MPTTTILTSSPCETLAQAQAHLDREGWVVLPAGLMPDGPRPALASFGRIVPQYDGQETWAVRVKPGFERVPYSQSANGIGAHTEAPVMDPPPKYLALHCHHQARCGGGHTLLADGLAFSERHGGAQRFSALSVEFAVTPRPGGEVGQRVRVPLLERRGDDVIFRFSYNQFRYGDVNPSEDALIDPGTALNRDAELVELTDLAEQFFEDEGVAILVPDDALLIWNNQRMMHARTRFEDTGRHLTRYWLA